MKETKIIVKGIIKNQDKYLLVKKWYDDRIAEPYQWEFIDGYVEIGGSPDDEVEQLVHEKTFLDIVNKKILYTWTYQVGDIEYIGLAYLCETETDIVILSEDLLDSCWVEPEEFENYIANKCILEDVLKALKCNK